MAEDLRHIVEQSFTDEETRAEKTPEEIRSETLETINTAKKLLEAVKNSQGEDSEFYQKALKEYEQVQSETVKLLPETLQFEELQKLKKEVSDIEKVSDRSQQDIRIMYLLVEKKDISEFTAEDISFIERNSDKYMKYISNASLLISIYNSDNFEKSNFPSYFKNFNETLKNDKRIIKLLVENFEESGMGAYTRIDNLLTKDFKSDIQNIVFMAQSFPETSQ